MIADALVTTGMATAGATGGLLLCYWLCRVALDHRRLAAWESEWARTGPRWTWAPRKLIFTACEFWMMNITSTISARTPPIKAVRAPLIEVRSPRRWRPVRHRFAAVTAGELSSST